jgi:hypothetical protein
MNLLSRNEEPEAEVRRGKLQKAPAIGEASCLDHRSQLEVDSVERMKTRTIDFLRKPQSCPETWRCGEGTGTLPRRAGAELSS